MIRRTLAAGVATSVAAALLVPFGSAAVAADPTDKLVSAEATPDKALEKGTVLDLGTASGAETYIVQLDSPAVPLRATAQRDGARTQGAEAYRKDLVAEQADLTSSIARITGSSPEVVDTYTHAINGIAVRLTRAQAQRVARVDGVTAVQVDFTRELTTDKGPEWIGAPTIWDGTNVPSGVGTRGEGVIVGVLDTGINPANPSFADVVTEAQGGDGYNHTNPLGAGVYRGVCATDPTWGCNDKLIGYWNLSGTDRYDDDGHGSHTASTSAGNQVRATAYSARGTEHEFSVTSVIKGVAPHANIIGYDVCDGEGCQGTSIVGAIDQAIRDGVDVINYSIGSETASNPWTDADALGFLNARAAGIHVATSAGNAGPGEFTLGGPGDVPWMTTVGATTHDRKYVASVTGLTADGGATRPNIAGAGLSGATTGAYPIVDAAAAPYNNPLCGTNGPLPNTPNDGSFPAGTSFEGQIVLCTRGVGGRVEKGQNVASLGAEGMILMNDAASGTSLNGDAHALPTAHITHADGLALRTWMASVTGERAALSGSVASIAPENGDIMAAFSSRGPNRAVSSISPSVSAPGVDILAAAGTNNETDWQFISGTSMASPHTAGALALLTDTHPSWTPAEAQSALMTTSERDITDSDGTVADWFDMGSGRIELRRAAKAGLLLDEDLAGYRGANPDQGGDVRTLNTASMADDDCLATCAWTRTFEGTATGAGTWTVSVESMSPQLTLSTDKTSVAVTNGGAVDVTVTARTAPGAATDEWLFGTLVLTPPAGSAAPVAHLPVGVLPSPGVLPDSIDVTTRRDAGSQLEQGLEAMEITDLQIEASGLVPEQRQSLSVPEDSTNTNAFDGNGTVVREVTVPEGAASLLASLDQPTAPDFDLFVGTGAVSEANVVCASATGGSAEHCEIAEPEAGTWWILVQNWEATTPGGTDTTDLLTAVVGGDEGNLRAEGPQGPLATATPFDLRAFWDEPEMDAGETWHGALTLSSGPGRDGDIGVVPVTINRVEDDVTKTADKSQAAAGDTITYTVDVAPNVSREDLTYTVTDTLPEGTTYVEGSATAGATYQNGVVSWTGDLASTYGEEGNYEITTSLQDATCKTPLGAGYIDLASLATPVAPQAAVTGDSKSFTAFAAGTYGFYGESYQGLRFTDDGYLVYGAENYGGEESYVAQSVPDPELPNSLAAMLWQDMQFRYDPATGAGVSLASTGTGPGQVAIIEYDDMRYYGDTGGTVGRLDMEVFATAGSSDLVFAYDNITAGPLLGGNASLGDVTIGTENASASQGAALVNSGNANGVIRNDMNVCLTYAEPEAPTAQFSYQVTVDADVHERQQLVNAAVHTTSDPGARPETASHTVVVAGAKERSEVALEIDPNRIQTGETTTATATVFSAGESKATGTVQFYAGDRLAGTGTLDAAGRASATLSGFASAGTIPVTARYLGDAGNNPSTSAPVNLVVWAAGTTPPQKVRAKIFPKVVKPLEVRTKATLRLTVTAKDVMPSGTVRIRVKGAGERKTYTVSLNSRGKAKIALPKFKKLGKVKVSIDYLGDAAVTSASKKITFRVVNRRTVR